MRASRPRCSAAQRTLPRLTWLCFGVLVVALVFSGRDACRSPGPRASTEPAWRASRHEPLQQRPTRTPAPPGRPRRLRRPGAYAGLQLVAASTMTSQLWWRSEWVRLQLHHKYPKARVHPALPGPGWQGWVPSAVTAFVLILSPGAAGAGVGRCRPRLVAAPGRAGPADPVAARSWHLGARAAQPGDVRRRLAGRGDGAEHVLGVDSAAIEAVVIAVPAMVLRRWSRNGARPCTPPTPYAGWLPSVVVVGAVIAWNHSAGEPQDSGTLAGAALLRRRRPRRLGLDAADLRCCRSSPACPRGRRRLAVGHRGRRRSRSSSTTRRPGRWPRVLPGCGVRCSSQPVAGGCCVRRRTGRAVDRRWSAADVERENADELAPTSAVGRGLRTTRDARAPATTTEERRGQPASIPRKTSGCAGRHRA